MRENTQTRSRQSRKYGGKQLSTANTSRRAFITHRITRGDSTSTPKSVRGSIFSCTLTTITIIHISVCCMHVCSDGKGNAEPSSVNISDVFLALLTFPGSVELLFQVLFHDRSHVFPLAALRLQSLSLRPLELTPRPPALGTSS